MWISLSMTLPDSARCRAPDRGYADRDGAVDTPIHRQHKPQETGQPEISEERWLTPPRVSEL